MSDRREVTAPGSVSLFEVASPAEQETEAGGSPRFAHADLPVPTRERFQPLRAGIVNLWQYDHQELRFHKGRLLLRGRNGSGKSKALEVLLPFLLDADLSPQRLDPFGGTSRTMRWNLLMDGRYESRVGYVWLELGRLLSDGELEGANADREGGGARENEGGEPRAMYWTLGCGLQAKQRTSGAPDSWYFLTPQRIGRDLDVLLPGGTPRVRKQLREALGEDGRLFDTGREYREALDRHLFGLGSEDRFANLRHLLLQLRRPQLSEKLDPSKLSELLTESLPPLDGDLVAQLSEGFERLDNDQKELQRVEAAEDRVRSFLDVYRDYGRGVARERAAEVRQADSRYHRTAGEVREAETEGDALASRLADLDRQRRQTRERITDLEGRIRALERSEAMRSAEALELQGRRAAELKDQAERDRRDAEREQRALAEHREEVREAENELQASEKRRRARASEASTAAREAQMQAVHSAALEALDEGPDAAQATVQAALDERREGLAELEELAGERDGCRRRHELAEERRSDAEAQVDAALARHREAHAAAEQRREELDEALLAWWRELDELQVDEEALEELRARVVAEPGGEAIPTGGLAGGLKSAVEALAAPQRETRIRDHQALTAETAGLEEERREIEEEREWVEAAREVPPEPPRTRDAERQDRAGAPFYRLVEFAAGLTDEEQAGIEAALEGAGLLDAWVMPGGRVLAPGTLDTVLVPTPRDRAGTLADLLVPAEVGEGERQEDAEDRELEVAPAVVEALLRSIDVGGTEGEGGEAAHRVGPDGRWRLGPLRGAWAKPAAEHIGARAREAARRRRLEELATQLGELERRLEEQAERRREIEERRQHLEADVQALPSDEPLREARHDATAARRDLDRRRGELAQAEEAVARARETWETAVGRLEARARELGLADQIDDLGGYRERLDRYEAAFRELFHTAGSVRRAAKQSDHARHRLTAAEERHQELKDRAEGWETEAMKAQAQYEELEATVGAEAREVVARLATARRRREEHVAEGERLDGDHREARDRQVALETELRLKRHELERRDDERRTALDGLRRLGEAGFLPVVLTAPPQESPEEPPEEPLAELPQEPPASWSFTRALELAREIERQCAGVELSPEARDRRADRLHRSFQTLAADLGADFQPGLHSEQDLLLVRVGYNGRDHDLPSLLEALREGIETRRALLADHERALLRRFLLGEVGDHLRDRLRAARELVDEMNRLLADCTTASGMVLKLEWKPAPEKQEMESAAEVRQAVEWLLQDPHLLSDADRQGLETFFRRRIDEARHRWEAVPWREHLLHALDYRAWYEFRVLRRTGADERWVPMTRRDHAASSGGEKAVALHLPLFAAAAAHYRSARETAPRLILLDEAFAGIDQGMRGRCMGLLVQFDLDFMMTSHDEWGCYEELPGVATYQLYRDPELEGVAAVRFVWDGRRLNESRDESIHAGR